MMAAPWAAGAAALLTVVVLVPIVRTLCVRFQLYDLPGPLKIHTQPIPRLGGVAVAVALTLGVAVAGTPLNRPAWSALAALLLVWLAGLIDDVRGLHPAIRLSAQIVAAVMLSGAGLGLAIFSSTMLNAAATCLFVVFFVNAFNFLDGADGIVSGVTALITIGYIALPDVALGDLNRAIAWSLLGACAGFLLFNFPPARIFLGDSGSSVLGFVAAFLGLSLARSAGSARAPLLFPLLVAALPLLDAMLAVFRRVQRRRSPFEGDRRHFYDLLLARGWTVRQVALSCYGVTAILVVAGWIGMRLDFSRALIANAVIAGTLLVVAVRLGALRPDEVAGGESETPAATARAIAPWAGASAKRMRQQD